MQMSTAQVHYNAIRWVKSDLDQTLSEARSELDALIETPEDITHLQRLRNLFREVHGVLDMVEVQGGVLLLEELRALLNVYADGAIRNQTEALEVISRAIVQLPDYLDYIERGNIDVPIVLLPLLNDLRTARDASLVSDSILMLPGIDQDQAALDALPHLDESLQAVARALRPLFQYSLLGWYKNQAADRNLLKIAAILHRLTAASKTPETKRLWWISQAVAEALQCHALETSITVKSLFGKIDRLLKLLISFDEQHMADNVPEELIKNLLFYVASANRGNSTVDAVKEIYQLNDLGVDADALELARASMSGPNQSMFTSIATALLDDVNEIKERVEVYALSDHPDNESLGSMEGQLTKLAETLGMLGLNRLREKLSDESRMLHIATDSATTLPREQIQGLANVLMDAEFDIRTYASGMVNSSEDEFDDTAQIQLPEHEYQKILSSIIYETLILINHCKEAILNFTQQPEARESLLQVPELIAEIKGAMTMLPLTGVLPLLDGMGSYIDTTIDQEISPGVDELDALADIIVSIEFYLESLEAGKGDHQVILERGAESLPQLMRSVPVVEQVNIAQEIDIPAVEMEMPLPEPNAIESADVSQPESEDVQSETEEEQVAVEKEQVEASEDLAVAEEIQEEVAEDQAVEDILGHLDVLPAEIDEEILEIFQEEAEEEVERIISLLPEWLKNTSDIEALGVMRRSFHTLKGSGRLVGAQVMGEFAWAHEELLNRVLGKTVQPGMSLITALETAVELLPELLSGLTTGQRPSPEVGQHVQAVTALSKGENIDEPSAETLILQNDMEIISVEEAEQEDAIDPELLDIFRAESSDYLTIIEQYAQGYEQKNRTLNPDPELYRAIHTLNGSARTAEFRSIYKPCALAETYMANCDHVQVNYDDSFPGHLQSLSEHVRHVLESSTISSREDLPEVLMSDLESLLEVSRQQLEAHEAELASEQEQQNAPEEIISENNLAHEAVALGAELDAAIDDEQVSSNDDQADEFDEELAEIFIEEAVELLDSSENAMATWQEEPTDLLPVKELQRYLHTLKGGARMAGFKEVGDLSHAMESLFLSTVEGRVTVQQSVFGILHGAFDQLQQMIDAVNKGKPVVKLQPWIDKIERCIQGTVDEEIEQPDFPEATDKAVDAIELHDELSEEAEVEESTEAVVEEVAIDTADTQEDSVDVVAVLSDDAAFPEVQAEEEEEAGLDSHDNVEESQTDLSVLSLDTSATAVIPNEINPVAAILDDGMELPEATDDTPKDSAEDSVYEYAEKLQSQPSPQPGRLNTVTAHESIRVRSDLLNQLVNDAGEVNIYHSRVEEQVVNIGTDLQELEQTIRRLSTQLRRLEGEAEAQILSQLQRDEPIDFEASLAGQDFDPLELDRYSTIQQLSRGLAESISDLLSIQGLLTDAVRDTETLLAQQTRVSTELQDGLMRTRMVPFNTLLPRLRRIVRRTASEMGKEVELTISGEASEVDRTLLDSMTVPLEHMLRNAIAHGIESPDVREQNEKRRSGSITVNVERHGNEVVILVEDDGAGINVDRVRREAQEKNLIDAKDELSDEDVIQLILESGFSTADELTQVAGRGVGMDIVNTEIKQLNGSLSISSEPGKGTCFRITLPFTLAINQALLIQSDDELYAIPMNAVEGVVRISGLELAEQMATGNAVVEYAGNSYELKQLASLLHQADVRLENIDRAVPVLLLRSSSYRIALLVTEVLGNREVVVKPLGSLLSTLASVSGATILGDGKVVLILDVAGLARAAMTTASRVLESSEDDEADRRQQLVMVVDDSITIRKVTARMLERHNFQVVTAKDGVDAVAKLQETKPDLMLLDIEMPRMDGYELAVHIRNQEEIKDLPIIMITSRTGKKHKDRAFNLGVNQYLGKPYQEGELMENINALLTA